MKKVEKNVLIKELRSARQELDMVRAELNNEGKSLFDRFMTLFEIDHNNKINNLRKRGVELIIRLQKLSEIETYDIFDITYLGEQKEREKLEFYPIGKITRNEEDEKRREEILNKKIMAPSLNSNSEISNDGGIMILTATPLVGGTDVIQAETDKVIKENKKIMRIFSLFLL